ncbi:MAG: PAS domain S-box protein, partial [Desulfobacterales bacterium]|nr:PAS domain S-box protein [Desulfobacterales bacterium]
MRTKAEIKCLIKALDAIENQIIVVSPEMEILAANAYALRSDTSEIIGKKCFEALCQKTATCDECNLPAAIKKAGQTEESGVVKIVNSPDLPCGNIYPLCAGDELEALVLTDIGAQSGNDASERLKLANAFLTNLIHSSPDAIIAADLKGKIQLFNEAAQKLSGYSTREVSADLNITDVFAEGEVNDVLGRIRGDHYGGTGRLQAYHVVILNKHGHEIPIRMDAAIISEGKKELAIIAYLRDLRSETGFPADVQGEKSVETQSRDQQNLGSIATSVARHLKLYNQQFSDTALRIGIIDRPQLDKAMQHQEQLQAKTKINVPLGRVLVQLGYITDEQRTAIIAMQALGENDQKGGEGETLSEKARSLARAQKLYNQRFGDLTVKLGFISEAQLERALQMQNQVGEKTKIDVPLGRVLEQLEYITEEQRAAVLAVQALAEKTETRVTEVEPEAVEPTAAETEPTAAETEPEAAETEPEAAETEPEAVETEPEAAETEPEAAETEPEAAETEP